MPSLYTNEISANPTEGLQTTMNRRNFNKVISISVAAPLVPIAAIDAARAESAQMLDPNSPEASAVAFKMESDYDDMNCSNCGWFSKGDTADIGSCIIFPGFTVPAIAACDAYQPKK